MSDVCSVCNDEPSVGVACVPGVPYSTSYGAKCLAANAHPWDILVGNTAALGGLDEAADWWKDMVYNTCTHLGKSIIEFEEDVKHEMKQMSNDE